MLDLIARELTFISYYFFFQCKTLFPYWLFGIIAGSVISVFAADRINTLAEKLNPQKFSFPSIVWAAFLGVASPICMYGTIPLVAALGRRGIAEYLILAFMVSSILLNPNLLIFSFALGTPLALARLCFALLAGILAGILTYRYCGKEHFFNFEGFHRKPKSHSQFPSLQIFGTDLYRAIRITGPYFFAGLLLSALSERYLSPQLIRLSLGQNRHGLGVILAASLGVPLYVCGGGTIPLLKTWLSSGMSNGAALAFMITGPATKLTNLSAVKSIMGIRNLCLFILYNLFFGVVSGILVDVLNKFL